MDDWRTDAQGDVIFSMLAGWQTGMSVDVGVALKLAFFATPSELRADAPASVQLLLTADHALELGEELIRQGRAALGDGGRSQ